MIKENHYLGGLCKQGHDYEGTGKSLRYRSTRQCRKCLLLRNQDEEYKEYKYLSNKKLRESNRERYNNYSNKSYHKHIIKNRIKAKARANSEKDIRKIRFKKWLSNHQESYKLYSQKIRKESSKELKDSYIVGQLTLRSTLKAKDIPQELIEIKRLQLKLYRLIKKKGGD